MYGLSEERDLEREGVAPEGRKYLYNFDVAMYDYIIRTLKPFFLKGSALELGCYKGVFTRILSEHFTDLTALDGSCEAVEETVKVMGNKARVLQGMIEDSVFAPAAKAENIFLMHVLEHTNDPRKALRNIRDNLLADSGRLFVVVPNARAASRQLAVKMGLLKHVEDVAPWEAAVGHRRTYASDTLQIDVEASGLKIVEQGGIFFKPLCNAQFDALAVKGDIVTEKYREACFQLGEMYPEFCASLYAVCEKA